MAGIRYKDILKATSLFAGINGLSILLQMCRTKLAALFLGSSGMGLNAIFNETIELIHSTSNVGMDKCGVREVSRAFGEREQEGGEERLRDAIMLTRSWVLLFALIGTLLCLVLAEPISRWTFENDEQTTNYMLLSPAVGLLTLTCGEYCVLRGIQRLRSVALVSILQVVASLVTTIPLYYFWGMKAVVLAILLLSFSSFCITASFSYRFYRPQFCFSQKYLKRGYSMLVIGIFFVLAGFLSHGSKLAVQAFLNREGSLDVVGLFKSGYSLVFVYCGMIFTALDTDYFPRLSSIFSHREQLHKTVNRQIEVMMTLVLPIILFMLFAMPALVPLLLSNKFMPVVPMAQIAVTGLLFRTVYLPASFMPLAGGDSRTYLVIQAISYLFFIPPIIIGYNWMGLTGTGLGLLVSCLVDLAIGIGVARIRYHIHVARRILYRLVAYAIAIGLAFASVEWLSGWAYWAVGGTMLLCSCIHCWQQLRGQIRQDA
ncbi:MAG: oligosaccharide flippase family protein [Bacteroidales bacterium]|nr:oligosaccharide flippase family protein [Candidatus Physcousia equi]